MGLSAATLNGHTVTDARLTIPGWGISYHDVAIDGEFALSGAAVLKVADLTIKGTFLSGGPAAGRSYFRLVAGAGGWATIIPAKSYANDLGVKLSTVLVDAANLVGETVDTSNLDTFSAFIGLTGRVGSFFTRANDRAARVLEQLVPNAWYVDESGATHVGQRPKSTLSSTKFAQTSQLDLARGTVEIASESIAGILPGVTVLGLEAVDVEHTVSKDGLRTKIWGRQGGTNSRRLAAYRSIFDQLDPNRKFRGVYEYRIVVQTDERLSLQPVRTVTGMPNLQRVFVRPGLPGCKATHKIGSRCLVAFIDADPTNPAVISFEDADGAGFLPPVLTLNGAQVLVGSAPFPLAFAAGTTGTLDAVETWVAALITALGANATPPLVAADATFGTATSALAAAILAAHASVPTVTIKGT